MCGDSGILVASNSPAVLTSAGFIPLGTAVHGYGCGIVLSGNGISIREKGWYGIEVAVSAAVTGTGAITLQLYDNGVPIAGASATATPAAAGASVNLAFPWMVKKCCCDNGETIQLAVSAAATINSVSVKVLKEK